MILGLDIGGTNTDVVILRDGEFEIIGSFRTEEFDLKKIEVDYEMIGVSIAAWFKKGKIVHAPNLKRIPSIETDKPK
ncbi:MAG: ROK family protein, partial [Archaeoglobaceae archaeon]